MKKPGKSCQRLTVRYGRNHQVVLALVLPFLLIPPFLVLLKQFGPLPEWLVWTSILTFSCSLVATSVWLAIRVYPPASIIIEDDRCSVTFDQTGFLRSDDFTFALSAIVSFRRRTILGMPYYVIRLDTGKIFQLSPTVVGSPEDVEFFDEEMKVFRSGSPISTGH